MEISLKHGVAIVDDSDFELVVAHHWHSVQVDKRSEAIYAATRINGRTVYMHRLIMDAKEGEEIDHRDRKGLNNSRANLRRATSSQNKMNQKRRTDNTSGRKGVSWSEERQKWQAYIQIEKKRIPLGRFTEFEAALAAREAAEQQHYREFARAA